MSEKAPGIKEEGNYKLYCPIILPRQQSPEIAQKHQSLLLNKLSQIISLTDNDYQAFYDKWKDLSTRTNSNNLTTRRYGITMIHTEKLISPQPFVETRHNFIEIITSFLEFNKFYRRQKPSNEPV